MHLQNKAMPCWTRENQTRQAANADYYYILQSSPLEVFISTWSYIILFHLIPKSMPLENGYNLLQYFSFLEKVIEEVVTMTVTTIMCDICQ